MNGSQQPPSRSLVSVAVELYQKRQQAEERFAKADAELKAWVKRLNVTESTAYDGEVALLKEIAAK